MSRRICLRAGKAATERRRAVPTRASRTSKAHDTSSRSDPLKGRDAEVAIVGGGPAGAAAATVLARAGCRVVIVERAPLPRDKVCGDLLGTDAIAALRTLRIGTTALACGVPLSGAVLHGPKGAAYGAVRDAAPRVRPTDAARVVPRLVLDAALLESATDAGATIVRGTVTGLVANATGAFAGVRLEGNTLSATATIGADGWGSIVARSIGAPRPKAGRTAVAVRGYAMGVRDLRNRMHFFVNEPGEGYGWIFPLHAGLANVGLGFIRDEPGAGDVHRAFGRFTGHASLAEPYLHGATCRDVAAWPIPLGPHPGPVAARGVFLAGDAASLASPLSGSGIANALHSGAAAARFARRALAGDGGAWEAYARWVRTRLAPRLYLEASVHRYCGTAQRLDACALLARRLGAESLLSRAMLALG